jgi:hypothetical protein
MRLKPPFLHAWDASRYPVWYLEKCLSEAEVQSQILQMLPMMKVFAWPVDSGAKMLRGRAFGALRRGGLSTAALLGRTGAAPKGVCDIIGVQAPTGRAVLIEVKKPEWRQPSQKRPGRFTKQPAGLPTDEQIEFLREGFRRGAIVGVAWSPSDVERILNAEITEDI